MPSLDLGSSSDALTPAKAAERLAFESVYSEWFGQVVRWLPAMGIRSADVEDVAQEMFLIVDRKLSSFSGGSMGAWLYAIALRVSNNHRRLAWVRSMIFRPAEDPVFDERAGATPEVDWERKQLAQLADEVLRGMSEKHRRAFVLFEIEGYDGSEIAELESIPLATVWTRIHHARKDFAARAEKLKAQGLVK
jgi:RNA polymerase sigma-70 factor (ECF subfamily)